LKYFYLRAQKHQKFSRKWLEKFSLREKEVILGILFLVGKVIQNKKVTLEYDFCAY